jgi:Protein of unknown function (DUF3990)
VSWQNDHLILYHGCTDDSLQPANPNGIAVDSLPTGIQPHAGSPRTDFGRGFYATTWLYQARCWANHRLTVVRRRNATARAVVLKFEMKRNDLANLECLVFQHWKRGSWLPFVRYCRAGDIPHASRQLRSQPYDLVYGPVSGSSSRLAYDECDQISFNTADATNKIPVVRIHERGAPDFQIDDPPP